ncbi:hypothetical protein L1987_81120 [Smallanthus sonchifolius]|uniref:Uncharacterized protein n=1 Tax=Smallanthus sonchifolius TaxID=185202 RepID=A0ACB8YPZ8_9ASTR|nr:hypothetical protein L1987_81120 [Smallanthus sonchifolius]
MTTTQLPSPTFVYSPTKPSFNSRSIPFVSFSSSSKSGSFAIKCSNNATANRNNNNGFKDLVSGWVVELSNKDRHSGLVDSLHKAAQRVLQPETETMKMKQVKCSGFLRHRRGFVRQGVELRAASSWPGRGEPFVISLHRQLCNMKMKQDLNSYKTRSNEKLAQQETEINEMKQELSRHITKATEIEECQKRLSEALTLVAEAELSLQDITQVLRSGYGYIADCTGSVYTH